MPFWKKSVISEQIPYPTGPHAVGYQDVMTPGPPDKGVFARIYYPCEQPKEETVNNTDMWPLWAEDEYLIGFAKFMQAVLDKWPSWAPKEEFQYHEQIKMSYMHHVMHLGAGSIWRFLNGDVYCPILKNAIISKDQKWPLIVFSTGMGTSRFAYTKICSDLASQGFVVVCIEHRDGTMAYSYTMEGRGRQGIEFRRILDGEGEYTVRNYQVKFRAEEVRRTMDLMVELNMGIGVSNVVEEAHKFDLTMLRNSMDLSKPFLAGHSFGGATTLLTLAQDSRFYCGMVLDGWMFPIKCEQILPSQPIIFINSESFLSKQNIGRMKDFTKGEDREILFIKGSVHQNFIDVPLILKNIVLKRAMGMDSPLCPGLVLDVSVKKMLKFIWNHQEMEPCKDVMKFLVDNEELLIGG